MSWVMWFGHVTSLTLRPPSSSSSSSSDVARMMAVVSITDNSSSSSTDDPPSDGARMFALELSSKASLVLVPTPLIQKILLINKEITGKGFMICC